MDAAPASEKPRILLAPPAPPSVTVFLEPAPRVLATDDDGAADVCDGGECVGGVAGFVARLVGVGGDLEADGLDDVRVLLDVGFGSSVPQIEAYVIAGGAGLSFCGSPFTYDQPSTVPAFGVYEPAPLLL